MANFWEISFDGGMLLMLFDVEIGYVMASIGKRRLD